MNRVPPGRNQVVSVHIGNLCKNTTDIMVRELFKDCGEITNVFVNRTNMQLSGTTLALVQFTTLEAANKAVKELNSWPMLGHKIKVSMSYRSTEGGGVDGPQTMPVSTEDYLNLSRFMKVLAEASQASEAIHGPNPINPEQILKDVSNTKNQLVPIISHPARRSLDLDDLDNLSATSS